MDFPYGILIPYFIRITTKYPDAGENLSITGLPYPWVGPLTQGDLGVPPVLLVVVLRPRPFFRCC
jgi:hypothetical protein